MSKGLMSTLRAVLSLEIGEYRVVRERCGNFTVYRYRDGWHFHTEKINDRIALPKALIGYHFPDAPFVADFLLGYKLDLRNFTLIGDCA